MRNRRLVDAERIWDRSHLDASLIPIGHLVDIRTLCRRVATSALAAGCLLGPALVAAPVGAVGTVQAAAVGDIANLTPPSISGTPTIGSLLTADPGTWGAADVTFGYQWQAGGVDIPGATASTFTLTYLQSAQPITVVVTATGAAGSGSATSAVLFVPPGTATNLTAPSISGTAEVGQTVTVDAGTWDTPDLEFGYQWRRGGTDIPGAVGASYAIRPADGGKQLSVAVTAARPFFNPATVVSAVVDVPVSDAAVAPVNLTPPTIPPAEVGRAVTADPGTWDVEDATFSYQWKAEGADIPGATGIDFTPSFDLLHEQLTVSVVATAGGLSSEPVTSAPVIVDQGNIPVVTMPRVTGDPRPGHTLTADPGTYDVAHATQTYEWWVDDVPVSGETSTTYVVRTADVGKEIQFAVDVRAQDWWPSLVVVDAGTALPGTLTSKGAPRIVGAALVGRTLRVAPGIWSATGLTIRHRWTVGGTPVATGDTFVVPASAAGKQVGVVETADSPAYVSASRTGTPVIAQAPATLHLRLAKPGKHKVKVIVTVTAATPVTGAVTVKVGHRTRTVALHEGRAVLTVAKLKKGKVRISATYAGSRAVTAAAGSRSTRIK